MWERERDGNSGSPPHLYIVRISDAFILLFFLFLCSVLIIGGWRTCLKTKVTLFPSALRGKGASTDFSTSSKSSDMVHRDISQYGDSGISEQAEKTRNRLGYIIKETLKCRGLSKVEKLPLLCRPYSRDKLSRAIWTTLSFPTCGFYLKTRKLPQISSALSQNEGEKDKRYINQSF